MTRYFIGSEIYRRSSYGQKHPLRIPRVSTVMDLVRALNWLRPGQYQSSPRVKPRVLEHVHDPEYLDALIKAEETQSVSKDITKRYGLGTLSCPVFPEMFRRPATAAGGSLLAAELAMQGAVVFNPGGGTHHGLPDRASGFCYLNDPVLAILRLFELKAKRVLYIDIDAHHCDGVEAYFSQQPDKWRDRLALISVHEARRWPFTGALEDDAGGLSYNLPVHAGFHDDEFYHIINAFLMPFVTKFVPDILVLQCGADSVAEDPLSRLGLTNASYRRFVRQMMPLAPGVIFLGGGGYNPWSVARCWSMIWAEINGITCPEYLPEAAQAILRALTWTRTRSKEIPAHWLTTLCDQPNGGALNDTLCQDVAVLQRRAGV